MMKMGSINISATSRINDMDVAYFSASFFDNNGGNYTISKNIANISAYEENKMECDSDYAEFEQKATEVAEQIKTIQSDSEV